MGAGLVGRERELAEIDPFLDAASQSFAALVLEGQAGIGKTTVWREARRRASDRGWLVLSCRPAEAEAKLSFAAVSDLLEPAGRAAFDELPAPQREALEVALLRAGPTGEPSVARGVAAGCLTLIRRLSATRAVVIAVDDWQWLDLPSRRVLEFIVRRLEAEHVGLLCSVRSPVAGPVVGVAEDRLRRVIVGPLSLAALGRIVGDRLGRSLPRPTLGRIARASGGNPFYALEIARLVLERGVESIGASGLPVPEDLRALTLSRIRRLPAETRDALLVAAVIANPTADCIDVDVLGPAEAAGIVTVAETGRVQFAHPLFASAVFESVPATRQRELHRRAARLVSDPEQRARHLALGSLQRDPDLAAQLDEAATLAASRGAPAAGAELAELAIQRTPEEDLEARTRRLLGAARFHFVADDLALATTLVAEVLTESTSGSVRAEAFQLAAQMSARRNNSTEAAELAARALETAEDDRVRAGIELDLVYCASSLGDLAGAHSHAQAAAGYADAAGERGMLGDALAVLTMAEFLFGGGLNEQRLAKALSLEDPLMTRWWIMRPSVIHGMLQLWTAELDGAISTLGAVSVESVERGIESFAPMCAFYVAWAHVWRGELGQAAVLAAEAEAGAELLEDPWTRAIALAAAALVHALDGATDVARAKARESLELFERLQFRSGLIWPVWALGLAELSDQNPAAADAVLGPLADEVAAMGGDPVMAAFLPDEIEALISLGQVDRAGRYLEPFERRSRELERAWAIAAAERCRGLLAGANGDAEAAIAAFERALAAHDLTPMPLERARTLLAAGQTHRRFKRRARARDLLEQALAVFDELGALPWAQRARAELARVGRPGGAADGLSETEQRVAELVAAGLSNQEVAERAFLSVKTVEANLTRIYRKLGVGSRVALANALHPGAEEGVNARPQT